MSLNPQDAYLACLEAYNTGRWWAALSLATALKQWAEANPGEARWLKRKSLMNLITIERGARRRLEQESTANA